MDYNQKTPIPKWVEKGKKLQLPDGNFVTFGGKNLNDNCIIVKDDNDKIHVNFVIKPDEYEVHLKDEKTKEKKSLFRVYVPVIIDLVDYWCKEEPQLVKWFPPKYWSRKDCIIDCNTNEIPSFRWQEGLYDVLPQDLENKSLSHNDVVKLNFSMGVIFNSDGKCQGMLMPMKKKKRLLLIQRPMFENIMNTTIGIDRMRKDLKTEYWKMKQP